MVLALRGFLIACALAAQSDFSTEARLATEAREANRVDVAIEYYQRALRLKPDWEEGLWYSGTLLYSADRPSEAADAFRALLSKRPNNGGAAAFLGLCEFELKEYERAVRHLEDARTYGVGDDARLVALTRYTLGVLYNRFSRFDEARNELEALVRQGAEEPAITSALGVSVLLMPYLPQDIPSDKRGLVAMAGKAAVLAASKQPTEADRLYKELLSRYADVQNVHYAYGVFLLAGSPEKAVEQFRRELALNPEHVPARLQLAHEALRNSDPAIAVGFAREAVKLAPNWYLPRQILGRALLEIGEVESAVRELEFSAKLKPENPQTHFHLARAYRKAGRATDANREQAEFMRLDKKQ